MTNVEIMVSKQLMDECEKEFNISPYDMSHPISANSEQMYNNENETMEIARTIIRKRDGIFCGITKIIVFDKIKKVERINYYFVENIDPETAQPIGRNYKIFQSFREVKKCY